LIREYQPADTEAVVGLAIRAWAPVFASLERVLGREMFARLHGSNWEDFQREAVHGGFVAVALNSDRLIGEIVMLATEPAHQGRGTGSVLPVARYFRNL
jgi:hypothetical protein